jgi:hypothetical protein
VNLQNARCNNKDVWKKFFISEGRPEFTVTIKKGVPFESANNTNS